MSERKTLIQHAITVLIGQLAVITFGVIDTVVMGRYDPMALAALAVGSAIYISVYVALLGVMQAMLPVLAESHGANSPHKIGNQFHQGIYLLIALSILGMVVLLSPDFVLQWAEVPQELNQDVNDYLMLLAIALPATLFFRLFSTLNQSIGSPKVVSQIQVIALLIKIPMTIFLALGLGFITPEGLQGCARATLFVSYGMLFVSIWLLKNSVLYQSYGIWRKPSQPEWKEIYLIAKLGIPNGLSVTVEVTSFTMMALFIAKMGVAASASHQVAANLAALLYMVPLSFSIATSARASYWIGAKNNHMTKQSILTGFELLIVISLTLSTLIWCLQEQIALMYVGDSKLLALTSRLVGLVALYHTVDALQTLSFFALRSLKITIKPFIIYTMLLWGMGLVGGYSLAYDHELIFYKSPAAFWFSSSVALFLVSLSLMILLRNELSRLLTKS
jgi:multidrug resistance protein, MATE family